MRKIFLIIIILFNFAIVNARAISLQDCYIYNADKIQLGSFTSIEMAYPVLGECLALIQSSSADAYEPAYAICERGTLWIEDFSGKTTLKTYAKIGEIIFTKLDVYTSRGIHIGDDIQKVYKIYGYPDSSYLNDFTPYKGIVDHWDCYYVSSGRTEHLEFGSRNGKVTAIWVSRSP